MVFLFVTGPIDEETKAAFVTEVERVGRDPVYWVRREASFAVGALAKVVSQEVVRVYLVWNSRNYVNEDIDRCVIWPIGTAI